MSETATATTALAVVEPVSINNGRLASIRQGLEEQTEIRAMVEQFVEHHMREGEDYGAIVPGTKQKGLKKAGAEKLIDLFRCTPKYKIMKLDENFETGFFNYIFRLQLVSRDTKEVLAEGFGACNSFEGKYYYRNAQRKCPKCGQATVFDSKKEPGFYCWAKKGGCGAQFKVDDESIVKQEVGKVKNDDLPSTQNTVLKMAKKRSSVDGAIALARCSDLFTQDVEDLAPEASDGPLGQPKQQPRGSRVEEVTRQVTNRKGPKSAPPRQNEPPPPSDADVPPHDTVTGEILEPPAPPMEACVPSGRLKGLAISKLSLDQLEWFAAKGPDVEFRKAARSEILKRDGKLPLEGVA